MVESKADSLVGDANRLSLRTLSDLLKSQSLSSESLVTQSIDSMTRGDSAVFTQKYVEQAMLRARDIDRRRSTGEETRRFAGIPISIKDLFDLEGQETWAGSEVLRGSSPAQQTAPAIAHLIEAGMVVIGKTNMTEFAYSGLGLNPHYGTPQNPSDLSVNRIPGGSSSGSAVSVANGTVAASVGTDTGGSVRIPASLCGLVGLKPGSQQIDKTGVIPLSKTLDSIGPLTRSVQCCADLYALMSKTPLLDLIESNLDTIRLLVPSNLVWEECSADTTAAMESVLQDLSRSGVQLVYKEWPLLDRILESGVQGCIAGYESWQWHQKLLSQSAEQYDPRVSQRILSGAQTTAEHHADALKMLSVFRREFAESLSEVDAVLYPTTAQTAPPMSAFADDDEYSRLNYLMLRNTAFGNVLDSAAVSLPIPKSRLLTADSLPVGMMLMRPGGDEAQLLSIAHSIESALGDQVG